MRLPRARTQTLQKRLPPHPLRKPLMRRRNRLAPRGRRARLGNLAANLLWSLWWLGRSCVRGITARGKDTRKRN